MQRFLLGLLLLVAGSRLFAQSIDDIEEQFRKGEYDKAKNSVEAFLAKEKNQTKADGWWYKGVIYNEIAKSDKYKDLLPDGRMEAFAAFKKYYEVDPKAIRATLEQHVRLFDIYNGLFDQAVKSFNEGDALSKQKKDTESQAKFADAYNNFKKALTVEEYISGKELEYNGFKFPSFDTTLVQNIGLSAYRAKKDDDAIVYYKMIADKKIAGKDNVDVYQLLIDYYFKRNDEANAQKYLALGRELFPKDDRWYLIELDRVDESDKKALFATYENLITKYPDKYLLSYNYAVELFNSIYTAEGKPANYKETQLKIQDVLKKTIEKNKEYPDAYSLISGNMYNMMFDTQDELRDIKGTTPADQKKRADIKKRMTDIADEMIPYAEKAYELYGQKETLRALDKGNYKKVAGYLSSAYEVKGDKVKSDEYIKKQEAIN